MIINPLDIPVQVVLFVPENENCGVVLPVSSFSVKGSGGLLDFDNSANTISIKANITPLVETIKVL
jgi:hypothetical protein